MANISLSWLGILIPLAAAGVGATAGALVSRHLRRQELYAEAAQKINDYLDQASDTLNEIDSEANFTKERIAKTRWAVNLAMFHSRRLESLEVTNRLGVTSYILLYLYDEEDFSGVYWVRLSLSDAMNAVVEFMILPRFPHWRRKDDRLPKERFPNTIERYRDLSPIDPDTGRANFSLLRDWDLKQRDKR